MYCRWLQELPQDLHFHKGRVFSWEEITNYDCFSAFYPVLDTDIFGVTGWLTVGTGDGETKQRSPRKHWRGQFHKSNEEGPPKDNDNQQTLYVTSYGGCLYTKFGDCFIHQHQTYNKLMLVQVTTGSAPMDNTSFQLQILNRISPKKTNKIPKFCHRKVMAPPLSSKMWFDSWSLVAECIHCKLVYENE